METNETQVKEEGRFLTGDEYMASEIAQKSANIRALLDEVHALRSALEERDKIIGSFMESRDATEAANADSEDVSKG